MSRRAGGKRPDRESNIAVALIVGVWYLVANSGDDGEVLPDEVDIPSTKAAASRREAQPVRPRQTGGASSHWRTMAKYQVNQEAVAKAEELIEARLYVIRSEWSDIQPDAEAENAFLERHGWEAYARWHLGLTEGADDETKARHGFVFGDFRRIHRSGLMACRFRATQWDHKEIELAAHDLIQKLDARRGPRT